MRLTMPAFSPSSDDGVSWGVQLPGTAKQHPTALGSVQGSERKRLLCSRHEQTATSTLSKGTWTQVGRLPFKKATGTNKQLARLSITDRRRPSTVPATVYVSSNDGSWDQNLFASTNGVQSWTAILQNSYYNYGPRERRKPLRTAWCIRTSCTSAKTAVFSTSRATVCSQFRS